MVMRTERRRPPRSPASGPSTSKPLTTPPRSQRRKPLITKVKRPSVRKLMGRVRRSKTGRSVNARSPQRSATMSAVFQFAIAIPGTKCATIQNAPAVSPHLSKSIIEVQLTINSEQQTKSPKNKKYPYYYTPIPFTPFLYFFILMFSRILE